MSKPLKWIIPGIKRILALRADTLPPDCLNMAEAGIPVLLSRAAENVVFEGVPKCEITEKHSKNGTEYESKITFICQEEILTQGPLAWVIIDNNNNSTLFGSPRRFIPQVTMSKTSGEFSTRAGISYEITCITPPAECLLAVNFE